MDNLENYISRAEVAWKSGEVSVAIRNAREALKQCTDNSKAIALKIFLARACSKQRQFTKSNKIYRELISDKIYLPPVILGLLYNNFKKSEKAKLNLRLMQIFVGSQDRRQDKTCSH